MLPGRSCVIHAARHPLDAALSCYAQPFAHYSSVPWAWDLEDIASEFDIIWGLAAHWEAAAPGRFHTLLYEDLVANPEAAASEALRACRLGLEFEPQMLKFHESDPTRGRGVHTASQTQVRRPLYNSSVARWRRYEAELAPLRARLGRIVDDYEARLAAVEARRRAEAGGCSGAGGPPLARHDEL